MGRTVVIDNTLCFIISNEDDEIFVLPRERYEPRLTQVLPSISTLTTLGVTIPDERGLEYLSLSPWGEYSLKGYQKYQSLEESARQILISEVARLEKVYRKTSTQFINANTLWIVPERVRKTEFFNPTRFGARQLLNFLEAFTWVSRSFTVECHSVGEDRDFDFKLYEEPALSIFGKTGKLIHHFRWSEFQYLEIIDLVKFSVHTIDGAWGAAMGRRGFIKR